MRTIQQIEQNISNIYKTINELTRQIELMKTEYRQNALECIGGPCDTFEEMIANMSAAKSALNTLAHMEIDLEDYV
jgi:septation ring formation regulator EzrA